MPKPMKLTEAQAEAYFKKHPHGQKQYDSPIGPNPQPKKSAWEQIRSGASSLVERAKPAGKKVKEWMEAHPSNRRERERPERKAHADREPRRTTRVDRYVDGKLAETVYFDEKPRPARKRAAPKRRSDPLGGIGKGLTMSDFIPSNMGLGQAMGYGGMGDPLPHQGAAPRKRKKVRAPKAEGSWMDPGYIPPELRGFF